MKNGDSCNSLDLQGATVTWMRWDASWDCRGPKANFVLGLKGPGDFDDGGDLVSVCACVGSG